MGKLSLRPYWLLLACAAAVTLTLYVTVRSSWSAEEHPPAAGPLEDPAWKAKGYKYIGADGCTPCHVAPGFGYTTDFVKLTEYPTWKMLDKHSLAAGALRGTLGQKMSKRLGGDEMFVLKPDGGCLGCHSSYFPGQSDEPANLTEGVSCDACHGPASNWAPIHNGKKPNPPWRTKTAQEKHDLGMRNLRDPVERARLCSSCHIGSAEEGRVVTHAMYAAGHPPLLSFEVASFSQALPPHWYDKKDVPLFKAKHDEFKNLYHLDEALPTTRLVLTGGAAALRQQLALIAGRATGSANWPELKLPALAAEKNPKALWDLAALAHSDCAACHHELRVPSWRAERGYSLTLLDGTSLRGNPGRPQPSLWSLSLCALAVPPTQAKPVDAALTKLHATCDARPFGDLDAVGKAATAGRDAVNLRQVAARNLDKAAATTLLKRLTALDSKHTPDLDSKRTPDFETARQLTAAFIMICTEVNPELVHDERVHKILDELVSQLGLFAPDNLKARYALVAARLEEASGKKIALNGSLEQMQDALQKAYLEMNGRQQGDLFKALLDPKHVDAMQVLRDRELAAVSRSRSNYDPATFQKQLEKLNALVIEAAPK